MFVLELKCYSNMNIVNVDRQVNPNHNGRSVELMEICAINGKLSIN